MSTAYNALDSIYNAIGERPRAPIEREPKAWERELAEARQYQREQRRDKAMSEIMQGKGDYWTDERADVVDVVRRMVTDATLTDSERWRTVLSLVMSSGATYAQGVADYPEG